jgi:hypothetical protein
MNKPIFVFAGVYPNLGSAEGDYEVIKLLHSCDEIGSYDAVVIRKGSDDVVAIHKGEKPTPRGAWIGVAAGAASAVACPHLIEELVESDAARAWRDHLGRGIPRLDAQEMRDLLEEDHAALVVVGIESDAGRIEQTAVEATRTTLKHVDADFDDVLADAAQSSRPAAPFTER